MTKTKVRKKIEKTNNSIYETTESQRCLELNNNQTISMNCKHFFLSPNRMLSWMPLPLCLCLGRCCVYESSARRWRFYTGQHPSIVARKVLPEQGWLELGKAKQMFDYLCRYVSEQIGWSVLMPIKGKQMFDYLTRYVGEQIGWSVQMPIISNSLIKRLIRLFEKICLNKDAWNSGRAKTKNGVC